MTLMAYKTYGLYNLWPIQLMAYKIMACIVMAGSASLNACDVVIDTGMAYTVMACMVMAYAVRLHVCVLVQMVACSHVRMFFRAFVHAST